MSEHICRRLSGIDQTCGGRKRWWHSCVDREDILFDVAENLLLNAEERLMTLWACTIHAIFLMDWALGLSNKYIKNTSKILVIHTLTLPAVSSFVFKLLHHEWEWEQRHDVCHVAQMLNLRCAWNVAFVHFGCEMNCCADLHVSKYRVLKLQTQNWETRVVSRIKWRCC